MDINDLIDKACGFKTKKPKNKRTPNIDVPAKPEPSVPDDDLPDDIELCNLVQNKPRCTLIVGPPGAGKSTMLKGLMFESHRRGLFKHGGIVFCPTALLNDGFDWLKKEHPEMIHPEYNEDILFAHIEKLKKWALSGKPLPLTYIIFDDCMGMKMDTRKFQNLITIYRHLKLCMFICTQYIKRGASTILRECISDCIAYQTLNGESTEGLYKCIGQQAWDRERDFKHAMEEVWQSGPHTAIYFRNHKKTLSETYFRLKIDPSQEFTVKYKK